MKQHPHLLLKLLFIFLSTSTFTFICGRLMLIPDLSHAESSTSSDVLVSFDIESVITLSTSTNLLAFELLPTNSGLFGTAEVVATVSTNNPNGYNLIMYTESDDCNSPYFCNYLVHNDNSTLIPSTSSTTPTPLTASSWGYSTTIASSTAAPVSPFLAIPLPTAPDIINTSPIAIADHQITVTLAALATYQQLPGTYEQTLFFTAVADATITPRPPGWGELDPEGAFRFTIDTRMVGDYFAEGDTPENNPYHFAGSATTFNIPTSGYVNGTYGHNYNWIVNCGGGQPDQVFTGSSASNSNGIACNYPTPGQYQIAIKPNGAPTDGWMNAYGSYGSSGTANTWQNRSRFKSIDTPLTNSMRTKGSTYRFARMFNGLESAYSIPKNLFAYISTKDDTDLTGMFQETFENYAFYNTTATIPSGLFSSLNTSKAVSMKGMFADAFWSSAQYSTVGTIPADLFSAISTASAKNISDMFSFTFSNYANDSSIGTIPSGLFSTINTSNVTDLTCLFWYTFRGYARKNTTATIPANLFSSVNLSSAEQFGGMFGNTFSEYAALSTTGTIPSGLFSTINTTGFTTGFYRTFEGTFDNYASASTVGTIPADLFSSIDTSSATDLQSMFSSTFRNYANASATGTIPAGLFSAIDTSSAATLSGMFYRTFASYATKNTSATIPAGLFNSIDTSSATVVSGLFDSTFQSYASGSTSGTIPTNLFNGVDFSNVTTLGNSVFRFTFSSYANARTTAGTDINDIWGNAYFAGRFTAANVASNFSSTFSNMPSLTGSAQTFINNKLGSITPSTRAATFTNTGVTDLLTIHANWK